MVNGGSWLSTLKYYLGVLLVGNSVWEFAQLPLYTLWYEGSWSKITFAVVHCTGGDLLIATASLIVALVLFGNDRWPNANYSRVALAAGVGGLGYTIFSEWLNTEIRGSWAYAVSMPAVPLIGTGLSPFLQWVVVPSLAFWSAKPRTRETNHVGPRRS